MLVDFYARGNENLTGYRTARGIEKATSILDERIELGALHRAYGQVFLDKGEFDSVRHEQSESIDLSDMIGACCELMLPRLVCSKSESADRDDSGRTVRLCRTVSPEPAVTNVVCSSWQTEEHQIQTPRPPTSRENLGLNR